MKPQLLLQILAKSTWRTATFDVCPKARLCTKFRWCSLILEAFQPWKANNTRHKQSWDEKLKTANCLMLEEYERRDPTRILSPKLTRNQVCLHSIESGIWLRTLSLHRNPKARSLAAVHGTTAPCPAVPRLYSRSTFSGGRCGLFGLATMAPSMANKQCFKTETVWAIFPAKVAESALQEGWIILADYKVTRRQPL